jgi:hypothetical protein
MAFTEPELVTIRHLILQTANPDDTMLNEISTRDPSGLRKLIRRHLALLIDPSVPAAKLCSVFNESRLALLGIDGRPISGAVASLGLSPVITTGSVALPPKYRSKGFSKPQTPPSGPSNGAAGDGQSYPLVSRAIPLLPPYESSRVSSNSANHTDPEIGSLAAILYPTLGDARVCRVIGKKIADDGKQYYLVVFFQEQSPCYVLSEYLFELKRQSLFPLGNEDEFKNVMSSEPISVDWLLERIFSSAQNLVITSTDVLTIGSQTNEAGFKPRESQVQQIMFQCVSYGALLVLCYISAGWKIPEDKVRSILSTILKAGQRKFASTEQMLAPVDLIMDHLLFT